MPQTNLFGEPAEPTPLAQEKAQVDKSRAPTVFEKKTAAILELVHSAMPGATPLPASEDAYLRDFWAGEGDPGIDIQEFVTFPARLLHELPDAWEIRCMLGDRRLVFATAPTKNWARHRIPAFDGDEWLAATTAVENERVLFADVARWLDAKTAQGQRWRLTLKIAMDGTYDVSRKAQWPVWRVLAELGMRLKSVMYP